MSGLRLIRVDPYFGFKLIDNQLTQIKNRDADLIIYEKLYKKKYGCLTPYINSKTHMTVICPIGHKWSGLPKKISLPCNNCKTCWDLCGLTPLERITEIIISREGKQISKYVKSNIKLTITCNENHILEIRPDDIISGKWCNICSNNNVDEAKKKFYNIIKSKGGQALTPYINSISKVDIMCRRKHVFSQVPSSTNMGHWCSICADNNATQAEARFRQKVHDKQGTVLSNYINNRTKVDIQCKALHVFSSPPSDINKGQWCPKCSNRYPIQAHNNFIASVKDQKGKVLGNYINFHHKVAILCEKEHIFEMTPRHISQGQWCTKCKNHCPIQAREKFEALVASKNGIIVGNYINTYSKILVRCSKNHEFSIKPNNATNGRWCRICGLHESHGERKVREYLTEMGITFQPEITFNWMPRKRYDFYFTYNGRNYIVEYDGIQHFHLINFFSSNMDDFEHRRTVDIDKTVVALNQGLFLIRISYNDVNYIPDIIEEIINDPNPECRLQVSDYNMYEWLIDGVREKL